MVKHKHNLQDTTIFGRFVLAVAIIEPLSTIPQIIDVYTKQDASSLSLLSWLLFGAASVVWLVYGIRINSKPLIASSVLWVTTELVLIVGILRFS